MAVQGRIVRLLCCIHPQSQIAIIHRTHPRQTATLHPIDTPTQLSSTTHLLRCVYCAECRSSACKSVRVVVSSLAAHISANTAGRTGRVRGRARQQQTTHRTRHDSATARQGRTKGPQQHGSSNTALHHTTLHDTVAPAYSSTAMSPCSLTHSLTRIHLTNRTDCC